MRVRKVITIFGTGLCLAIIALVAYRDLSYLPRLDRERAHKLAYQNLLEEPFGSSFEREDPSVLVLIYFPVADPRAASGVTFKSTGRIWYISYLYNWTTKGYSGDMLSPTDKRAMEKICEEPSPSTDKPVFRSDQVIAFFRTPGGSEQRLYTRSTLPAELGRLFEESLKRQEESALAHGR